MRSRNYRQLKTTEEKVKQLAYGAGKTITIIGWIFTAIMLGLGAAVPRNDLKWAVVALLLGNFLLFVSENFGTTDNRGDF